MHCRYCNSDNSATNAFCGACGKPLGLACKACGHLNRPNSHFCGSCSAPLSVPTLPRSAAEQALRALSASGGERKHLTVIFAAISNSTALIDHTDPEEA